MGTFTCAMKFPVIVAVLAVAEAQYQNGYQQQQQVQGSSRWYQNGAVEGNANQGSSRWNKNYPNQANNGNNGNNGNQGDYQANDQAAAANVGPIEEQQTPETLQ